MPVPAITAVALTPATSPARPLLVIGPSLGTAVTTLWSEVARLLADRYDVVGWDLPGHGHSAPTQAPFTIGELAAGVLAAIDAVQAGRGEAGHPFTHVGDSVGGTVGLRLALDAPDRLRGVAVVCSSARFGTAEGWAERAATVRASGTPSMVTGSAERWFAPGFLERRPDVGSALLHDLQSADAESYALVAEALGGHDVRDDLPRVDPPVLVVTGALDQAAPTTDGRLVADGVAHGALVELAGVAHQAPVEAPQRIADLLGAFLAGLPADLPARPAPGDAIATAYEAYEDPYAAGLAVRRAVLGDRHVDRATAAVDDVTRDFQQLITRYAWGSVWTRPGLDRRSRSMVTLMALVAHGHLDELAMHVRAAVTNGVTRAEIVEVLLQSAVYCGVPAANSAFRVAQQVLGELDVPSPSRTDLEREQTS